MTPPPAPKRSDLPAPLVQDFRNLLDKALEATDSAGRKWSYAKWGCYAFYDYDGEPIYVGQTNEKLRTRVRRHLTNQRTDAVAMRILDVFEVAEMELWPLWDLENASAKDDDARSLLNAVEYSAYVQAIKGSRFHAILNEKIPPRSSLVQLPPSRRFELVSAETRRERGHDDTRIARRAETLSRLTAVAHERGAVSPGLRRVVVIQAARLAHLAAARLAHAEGRPEPSADAIDIEGLVGTLFQEHSGQPEIDDEGVDLD
ncbi:GIY-YIG nuclease family protein [Streptomyces sp. NPDC059698]|uniref:GIY-YIG nuclease family protein n=1 Tax=unclassified Streptomyces TaxID=2593676 RepID=UPI000A7D7463|nr:GIY-YIG nuclease family protein [Streptomyces sp. CB02366]WSS57664.1 GIY-YIG nuclease family protein [Streptomyces sp. NBC_01178]